MEKILKIFLIILICSCCSVSITYASSDANFIDVGRNFIELGRNQQGSTNLVNTRIGFNDLAGILWWGGLFVILIIGTILGIKYMFASVEEKASIKESIKPFLIGSIIILGAFGIWKFLVEFMENIL